MKRKFRVNEVMIRVLLFFLILELKNYCIFSW